MAFDLFLTPYPCRVGPQTPQVDYFRSDPEVIPGRGAFLGQSINFQTYWMTLEQARVPSNQTVIGGSPPGYTIELNGSYSPVVNAIWHFAAPGAVFCIELKDTPTLYVNDYTAGVGTLVQAMYLQDWAGRVSYWPPPDDKGPGIIGVHAVCGYVWRAGYGVVGTLWKPSTNSDYLNLVCNIRHNWDILTDGGVNNYFPWAYSYGATGTLSPYNVGDVTGIQDGDLLCLEYHFGRYFSTAGTNFAPWPHPAYPDSYVDGVNTYTHKWGMPVGGTTLPSSATSSDGHGIINLFHAGGSTPPGVTERAAPFRQPNLSVGF